MDSTDEQRSVAEVKKQNMVTLIPLFLRRCSVPEIKIPCVDSFRRKSKLSSTDRRRSGYLCSSYFTLQTIDRLASHLQNHLPREARVKIQNIAIEYVKCQVGVVGIIRGSVHTTPEEF